MLAILVAVSLYFNPRTPRGVRRGLCAVCPSVGAISIHAPREGCDGNAGRRPGFACLYFNPRTPRGVRLVADGVRMSDTTFQSTHPARGATLQTSPSHRPQCISIHAPREGCDVRKPQCKPEAMYFNPRTPRGVRLLTNFLCTLSGTISIHAPREGCDACPSKIGRPDCDFNPRTPRGVRRPGRFLLCS